MLRQLHLFIPCYIRSLFGCVDIGLFGRKHIDVKCLDFIRVAGFTFVVCNSDVRYINWTLATERGQSHKERDYSHPAYNEVAVSPCDLTEDSCDIHCCSDQACYQKMNISNNIIKHCDEIATTYNL